MAVHTCNNERLRLILSDDEASDDVRAAARHVETCETCQQRLTTLAGDAEWWNSAQTFLSGEDEPRWEPDASWSSALTPVARGESVSLGATVQTLLSAPSHPEMLGRLGRYDIERVIGSGGMGIVLKAHDSELNRPIAIKVLAAHLAHVGAARERFAREGRAAAAVVHEHVVAIYNVETDGEMPFLVMQYVPGRSLQTRVDEDGPLAALEVLRIGEQAAAGLAAAHRQGLVHRDVKPSNILLEDTVERAILTDFGLARAIDDASLTQTGVVAGTPHYMSPEQATGGPIDHRSDLFSLGSVLYFMTTGRPPFRASGSLAVLHRICHEPHRPVWQVNPDVPDELCDVIDRLLEKKPGRRFAGAEEVQDRIASLLNRAQRDGFGRRRFRAWRTRLVRRTVTAAAAIVLVGVAILAVAYWWSPREAAENTSAPEPSPAASTPTGAETLAAFEQYTNREQQFAADLDATQTAVERAASATYFLQQGDADWSREMESLNRDVRKLEMQQLNDW